jgi:hypothetical protein
MAPDAAPDVHTQGTKVWVRDAEDSWKKGEVVQLDGSTLTIKAEGGQLVKAQPDDAPLQNPEQAGGVEVRHAMAEGAAWSRTLQDRGLAARRGMTR